MVRLVGIEQDGASVDVFDVLLVMYTLDIVVLIVDADNTVGSQEPGHFNLAGVVLTGYGHRDERLQFAAGRRHGDGHSLEVFHLAV